MDLKEVLLQAIHDSPGDELAWQALADQLEEEGDARCDLLRLHLSLRREPHSPSSLAWEEEIAWRIAKGARPLVPTVVNAIGMSLSLVPAGQFVMGSPPEEAKRQPKEGPQHRVEITRPFYVGATPVTQEQYERVVGHNPSAFAPGGDSRDAVAKLDTRPFPVEKVSWEDARAFCKKLGALREEAKRRRRYRLPTEAEWEYACRGAMASSLPFSCGRALGAKQANVNGRSPYGGARRGKNLRRPSAVGSYAPNVLGLFDLHGNLCEWCADWYDDQHYTSSPQRDPTGPKSGGIRVLRGGSYRYNAECCRSAFRDGYSGSGSLDFAGIRVVMEVG